MTERFSTSARRIIGGFAAMALGVTMLVAGTPIEAQSRKNDYTPTIWVDPDGCEHWVMDDGWEGYMSPTPTVRAFRSAAGAMSVA